MDKNGKKKERKLNSVIDKYKSKYLYDKELIKDINSNKIWSQDELKIAVSDIESNDKSVRREREILGIKKCPFPTVTSVSCCEREILPAAGSSEIFLNSTLLDSENLN